MFATAIAGIKARVDAVVATAIWGAVAGLAALVALAFLIGALFVWISDQYSTVTACIVLAAMFAVIALFAGLMIVIVRRRRQTMARLQAQLFTADAVNAGLGMGETLRAVPGRYLVLGAFAAGLLASLSMGRNKR